MDNLFMILDSLNSIGLFPIGYFQNNNYYIIFKTYNDVKFASKNIKSTFTFITEENFNILFPNIEYIKI